MFTHSKPLYPREDQSTSSGIPQKRHNHLPEDSYFMSEGDDLSSSLRENALTDKIEDFLSCGSKVVLEKQRLHNVLVA